MFVRMKLASGESVVVNTTQIVMAESKTPAVCKLTLRSTMTHGASQSIEVQMTLDEVEALPPGGPG